MKIFISNAIEHERLPSFDDSAEGIVYGRAHYSWKIIAEMYQKALKLSHIPVSCIRAPDIYQSSEAREIAGISSEDIHMTVKPIEHIRPMFGVRNFFVCGWEFPEYSQSAINGNPAYNFISTMRRANKVLCWSSFTANNLKSYGLENAVVLPPPVAALTSLESEDISSIRCNRYNPSMPHGFEYSSLGTVRESYKTIFFMVLNPYDYRKNFAALVKGFTEFAKKSGNRNSALVVKLVVNNTDTTAENAIELLQVRFDVHEISKDIFFFGENVSKEQMMGCYKSFDFYACSSSTEGLNLPLIESMLAGMTPISISDTAMQDYINVDNAIVLPAKRAAATAMFSSLGGAIKLSHFPPSQTHIASALSDAARMSDEDRALKSERARLLVKERYGINRFEHDFKNLVEEQ